MKRAFSLALTLAAPLMSACIPAAFADDAVPDGLPSEIYEKAVAGITPEMMTSCETMALQAIATQAVTGAGVEWLAPMKADEVGRRISGSWADRVGRTEDAVAALDKSYLVAITGKVQVSPAQGPAFAAIPVCWFDFEENSSGPILRTATLRK